MEISMTKTELLEHRIKLRQWLMLEKQNDEQCQIYFKAANN